MQELPAPTLATLIFSLSSFTLVVQGWLLRGISITVVMPPAAAAEVPVVMPAEQAKLLLLLVAPQHPHAVT
jgi:hypothetical protein